MNKFKSIMLENHTKAKGNLHNLYTERHVYRSSVSSSQQEVGQEKLFHYREMAFQFAAVDYKKPENLLFFVYVPKEKLSCGLPFLPYVTAYEDYLLRLVFNPVMELSGRFQNTHKNMHQKPKFSLQDVNSIVQKRSGSLYVEDMDAFRLLISFQAPLINGTWLNGKSGFRAVKEVLGLICDRVSGIVQDDLRTHILTYARQMAIREYLQKNNLAAFIADGSILPRMDDTDMPMDGARPFISPKGLRVKVQLPDGGELAGMGLRKGITVITGGGYSGKSTLLDSLEMGIYNHKKGDGREYVITDYSACKIYAEDGRCVRHFDLSPFFTSIPGRVHDFSTSRASGSVSQAANIIEAVYGGSALLLIDEDTSATNFMIRDANMRKLVRKEPIVPFTDRVEELKSMGVSTVLVIGGSSEYLKYADIVLMMEDYRLEDMTEKVRKLLDFSGTEDCVADEDMEGHVWTKERLWRTEPGGGDFTGSHHIDAHTGWIKVGNFTSDISRMTSVVCEGQANSLSYLLGRIIGGQGSYDDLNKCCKHAVSLLFSGAVDLVIPKNHEYLWLEEVRALDLLMAASRLRENPTEGKFLL